MLYIIHQKIEKDNDKLFYFQHNLSDFETFSEKEDAGTTSTAGLPRFVGQVGQVGQVRLDAGTCVEPRDHSFPAIAGQS